MARDEQGDRLVAELRVAHLGAVLVPGGEQASEEVVALLARDAAGLDEGQERVVDGLDRAARLRAPGVGTHAGRSRRTPWTSGPNPSSMKVSIPWVTAS